MSDRMTVLIGRTPASNPAGLDHGQALFWAMAPYSPKGYQGRLDAFKVLIRCCVISKYTLSTERLLGAREPTL